MYKNFFWFSAGYLFARHVMPVTYEVLRKTNEKRAAA